MHAAVMEGWYDPSAAEQEVLSWIMGGAAADDLPSAVCMRSRIPESGLTPGQPRSPGIGGLAAAIWLTCMSVPELFRDGCEGIEVSA